MAKPPTIARLLAVPMGIIALVALMDNLGNYRWFWPYDRDVFGIAIFIGLLWYIFFGAQAQAWAEEEQARRDRDDGELS